MTTAADIALKVAREVTDVMDGAATAGATTSITDTNTLRQPNQYWDVGTVWIRSGTHAGKALPILGYSGSKISFASLGAVAVAAGDRYSVIRGAYPFGQIMTAIQQALDETHVTGVDHSLTGDGTTLDFTLPTGVYDLKRVQFKRDDVWLLSTHWHEMSGVMRFDYGYAPTDEDEIYIYYRDQHPDLTAYSTTISDEISVEWLKYKAAEHLLWWGLSIYGGQQEYRIEERMNRVLTGLKGKMPRRDAPDFVVNTAGIYG